MIACLDVHYRDPGATAASVLLAHWEDAVATAERTRTIASVAPYLPGQFYRRELPCLLSVLALDPLPDCIVVDGYVWLDGHGRPGLGAHLWEALGRRAAVIGVAKTAFMGAAHAVLVRRGESARPLYVTSAGKDPQQAGQLLSRMAGSHRIPTLLKRVDALSRRAAGGVPLS